MVRIHLKRICMLLILALAAQSAFAKLYYRYKGENDMPVLDDNIPPPEYVKKGYTIVNEQGVVVEVVAPAKTESEKQAESAALKIKKQQDDLRRERAIHDSVLMGNYLNIHDVYAARDRKLAALDILIDVARSNNQRLQRQLAELRSHQQKGKQLTSLQQNAVNNTMRQIADNDAAIRGKYAEQQIIRLKAAVDAIRFQYLKTMQNKVQELGDSALVTAECQTREQCKIAWQLAQDYVKKHSLLPIEVSDADMMLTAPAIKNTEMSMSVGFAQLNEDKAKIVILVECVKNDAGNRLCQSPNAQKIKNGLVGYVQDGLKTSAIPQPKT